MNFVEELGWRGMLHDMMPGTEELLAKEQVTALHWFRPYCGLFAHRAPLQCDDFASLPALRTQAVGTDWRCYGYDW